MENSCIRQSLWTEYIAPLPSDLVSSTPGLAMDIGGSAIKIVYRAKNCTECGKLLPQRDGVSHVHMIMMERGQQELEEQVFEHMKDNADVTTGATVYCTGIGMATVIAKVEKIFDISVQIISEMSCVNAGFVYVLTHPALLFTDWIFPPDTETEKQHIELLAPFFQQEQSGDDSRLLPEYSGPWDSHFPCLLQMVGSGVGVFKVTDEDSKEILHATSNGGARTFLGLGHLLTGAKTGQELISLAEAGDEKQVDEYTHDSLPKDDGDDTYYAAFKKLPSISNFPFGKVVPGEPKRKEDIARALLLSTVQTITNNCTLTSRATDDVTSVFVTGGWANNPLVRREMTKAFILQALVTKYNNKKRVVRPYFVRYPAFLGALGCLVHHGKEVPENKSLFCWT